MIREFREFAMRGNVIDMAVGIIIGAAFGSIIDSLVNDLLMPLIGLLLGNVDFSNLFITLKEGAIAGPYSTVTAAQEAGAVTLNYGIFINSIVTFLIVAFAVFLLIRSMNRLQRQKEAPEEAPTTRPCPFCTLEISPQASRCPHCTSPLESQVE